MKSNVVRILLVDDNVPVRLGAKMLLDLDESLEVTAEASSAEAALEISDADYDLVVTDLKMGGLSGLDLARLVKRKRPQCPVVLISSYDEAQYAEQAVERSVSAYLMKDLLASDLASVVKQAAQGRVWLSKSTWDRLLPPALRVRPEPQGLDATVFEHLAQVPMPSTSRAREHGIDAHEWAAAERRLQVQCSLYSPVQLTLLAHWLHHND